ncbi:DUF1015 domain-containing protein [Nanoarchaeota archaeon]
MVKFYPFQGLRPKKEFVSEIVSSPYDVISDKEAEEYRKNLKNMIHILLPKGNDDKYGNAKKELDKLRGFLLNEEKECFYIYQITSSQVNTQTGIFGITTKDDFDSGKIKEHELTKKSALSDRTNLLNALNVQTGPIYMFHKENTDLERIKKDITASSPEYDVKFQDQNHKLWVVNDEDAIKQIKSSFNNIDLYIADGHHRSEVYRDVCGKMFSCVFSDYEINILPYNKAIKSLPENITKEEILKKLENDFEIKEIAELKSDINSSDIVLLDKNSNYLLKPKDINQNPENALENTAINILQKRILEPLLGIKDIRKDVNIINVGGQDSIKQMQEMLANDIAEIGFSLPAITPQQLIKVSDKGLIMPPKSTWFEPKLLSGMVLYECD